MIVKRFNLNNLKELKKAERFKVSLENKGLKVECLSFGLNSVEIRGLNE